MLLNWKEEITKIDPDIKFRLNGGWLKTVEELDKSVKNGYSLVGDFVKSGDFEVEYIEHYMQLIMNWRDNGGKIVHLTMYGSQAHEVVDEIRESGDDILIIVGGSKVPTKIYENADWNVSVTTQPHSEVSSLGVFQHLLMDGKEFDLEFDNPVFEVIPTAHGKNVNVHKENKKE